ncbi:GNAT family N-acetyltransferase [Nocardia sp. NBC_01327]|uniref:GNAT family N-acetyltransferase n=1 Tax=Nocardia sp. NBC_01327 TaxID=2903593 RepID=UPI002E15000B|nr:GNAT family N-acetyltransferase [Nocardia sp. NBC_01327]
MALTARTHRQLAEKESAALIQQANDTHPGDTSAGDKPRAEPFTRSYLGARPSDAVGDITAVTIAQPTPADATSMARVHILSALDLYLGLPTPGDALGFALASMTPRKEGYWPALVAQGDPGLFVARSAEGNVLGLAHAVIAEDGTGEIGALYVLPSAQSRGIGARLMEAMLEYFGPSVVHVGTTAGSPAEAVYKRYGFKKFGPPTETPPPLGEYGIEAPQQWLVRPSAECGNLAGNP